MSEQTYPFYNLDGKLIESENDELMRRKHGYNYGSLKEIYPEVHKLPETEIKPLIDKLYEADESMEDTVKRVKSYIAKKEPEWKTTYFGEKSENDKLIDLSKAYTAPDLQTYVQPLKYPMPARKPKRTPDVNDLFNNNMKAIKNDIDQEVKRQQEAYQENQKRIQEYYDKGFYLTPDQWKEVALATGKGLVSGLETAINGMTGGYYSDINEAFFDNSYSKRRNELLYDAELEGLGQAYNYAQLGTRVASSLLPLSKIKKIKQLKEKSKDIKEVTEFARDYIQEYFMKKYFGIY